MKRALKAQKRTVKIPKSLLTLFKVDTFTSEMIIKQNCRVSLSICKSVFFVHVCSLCIHRALCSSFCSVLCYMEELTPESATVFHRLNA